MPLVGGGGEADGRRDRLHPGAPAAAAISRGGPHEGRRRSGHGAVQGVFDRRSAQSEARRLGLDGWVKNMSDGTVALRLQGEPGIVDEMLGWCRVGPPGAEVGWLDVQDASTGPDPHGLRGPLMVTLEDVRQDAMLGSSSARPTEPGRAGLHRRTVTGTPPWWRRSPRTCCCAWVIPSAWRSWRGIAGYLHDMGNGINRLDHGIAAALLSQHVLQRMGMPAEEYAEVMCAIGNHEEDYGQAVSPLAAAVILGDKSDVHSSRVRHPDPDTDDIHDRVNLATTHSFLMVDGRAKTITLELAIDTSIIALMEYFEIFLARMVMCRRAAEFLGCEFGLVINQTRLL